MAFGKHIKRLRESKGLFLREVGAALELDSAFISKVENEERPLPRKHIEKLAEFLNTPIDELLVLWFSDKIKGLIDDKEIGKQALKIVLKELNAIKNNADQVFNNSSLAIKRLTNKICEYEIHFTQQ